MHPSIVYQVLTLADFVMLVISSFVLMTRLLPPIVFDYAVKFSASVLLAGLIIKIFNM